MIKSLRWRLQIWYTGLLLAVVGGFGSILYFQTRASKLQEIDGQLEAAALVLDASVRGFPAFELDGKEPPPPPPPPPKEKKGPKGGPGFEPKEKKGLKGGPPRDRERLFADLTLPRELEGPGGGQLFLPVPLALPRPLRADTLGQRRIHLHIISLFAEQRIGGLLQCGGRQHGKILVRLDEDDFAAGLHQAKIQRAAAGMRRHQLLRGIQVLRLQVRRVQPQMHLFCVAARGILER